MGKKSKTAKTESDAVDSADTAPEMLEGEDTVKTEDFPADNGEESFETTPMETTSGEESEAPTEEMPAEPAETEQKPEEPVSEDKMLEDLGVAENEAPNGTGIEAEGAQSYNPGAALEEAPKQESEKAVEPEAVAQLPETREQDPSEAKPPIEAELKAAGNKVYEEPEARTDIGKVVNNGTTAAFIEIVQSRQPALEAALRAAATSDGLADGSIKPEEAPGSQLPEGARDPNDGGPVESGNSLTSATGPADPVVIDPKANAEGESVDSDSVSEATEKETVL